MSPRFYADYIIGTPFDVQQATLEMAGEQSMASSLIVKSVTAALQREFGARVESVEVIAEFSAPYLEIPNNSTDPIVRANVHMSWPIHIVGNSIPNAFTT